jgi:dolichyl-phosphate beta-glucosyltransferase
MKLSVIIPARNEAHRIEPTLLDVGSYLARQSYQYEIIVMINDSHDSTYDKATHLASGPIQNMKIVVLNEKGKGNAVKIGIINHAEGDIILFMDADNATPISEIENFLPYFEKGHDIVIGSRYLNSSSIRKSQPMHRRILGRLSNGVIKWFAVPGIQDTQLGFKAFNKKSANTIFQLVDTAGWGFDIEVLVIGMAQNYSIKEIGVEWTEPGGGQLRLNAYFESLIDLLRIKIKNILGNYNQGTQNFTNDSRQNITLRDYDFAGIAGFLAGIFTIPTVWNLGFHTLWIIGFPIFGALGGTFAMRLVSFFLKKHSSLLQFMKFAAVGILNVSINFGLLNLLSISTGITGGILAAGYNIPGTAIAAFNSYFWNKFWVFKKGDDKGIFYHLPKFSLIVFLDIAINALIIIFFTNYLHPFAGLNNAVWMNISKVVATATVLIFNFFGYKFIVFKS